MRTNNYTRAASGPSIELTCFYDTDQSHREFEENFQILQSESYSKSTITYYIENGNVKDADDISFSLVGSVADILKLHNANTGANIIAANGKELEEIKEGILDTYGERITLLNFEDASKVFSPLIVQPSKNVEYLVTRGYSQGDYAKVYFCRDDLHTSWGRIPTDGDLQKIFDHLFWDAPIYACFEIDGQEYRYDECPEYDDYEWNKDAFAAYVAKESGVPVETLTAMLPEYPDYN